MCPLPCLALPNRLDPDLAEAVSTTYYFLDWRDYMPVSAIILNQHGLLPDDAELDEVGCGGVVDYRHSVSSVLWRFMLKCEPSTHLVAAAFYVPGIKLLLCLLAP
jgi:hypothetical protein